MYDGCPLIDSRRKPLKLSSIRYEHLNQLKNEQIEEGYTIEYKAEWNKDLTDKHLCKTIASFANSSGGWLFVGISNDGSIKGIKKQKFDFSQQIGNLLAAHTSPIPVFDCRFIKSLTDSETGVLVIHVFEGFNPPYVSKGQICVRNGSNKTPVNANRSDIDNLFAKSSNFKNRLNELLLNPIGGTTTKNPCCVMALCNLTNNDQRLRVVDIENIDKSMKNTGMFSSSIMTAESIIFLGSDNIAPNNVTSFVELFFDRSIRIICYLPCLAKEYRDFASEYISRKNSKVNISDFVFIDFCALVLFINNMIENAFNTIEIMKQELRLYSIQCEFRNTRDTLLYYEPVDEFYNYLSKNGVNYSLKNTQRTFIERIMNVRKNEQKNYLRLITYKYFANAFGFDFNSFYDLYLELRKNHEEYFKNVHESFCYNYDRP